jgi:hypothetical protein
MVSELWRSSTQQRSNGNQRATKVPNYYVDDWACAAWNCGNWSRGRDSDQRTAEGATQPKNELECPNTQAAVGNLFSLQDLSVSRSSAIFPGQMGTLPLPRGSVTGWSMVRREILRQCQILPQGRITAKHFSPSPPVRLFKVDFATGNFPYVVRPEMRLSDEMCLRYDQRTRRGMRRSCSTLQ